MGSERILCLGTMRDLADFPIVAYDKQSKAFSVAIVAMSKNPVPVSLFGVPMGNTPAAAPVGGDSALFDQARRAAETNAQATNARPNVTGTNPPGSLVAPAAPTEASGASGQRYDYTRYAYSDSRMLQAYEQNERQHIMTLYNSIPGNTA